MRPSLRRRITLLVVTVGASAPSALVGCGDDDSGLVSSKKPGDAAAGRAGTSGAGGNGTAGGAGGGDVGGASAGGTNTGGGTAGGAAGAIGGSGSGTGSSLPGFVRYTQKDPTVDNHVVKYPVVGEAAFPLVAAADGSLVFTSSPIAGQRTVTTCTRQTEGACVVTRCTRVDLASSSDEKPKNYASAGDIRLTGLSFEQTLTFANAEDGYLNDLFQYGLWKGGETGSFQAMGTLDIPAFSGKVIAPPRVNLEKPAGQMNDATGRKDFPVDTTKPYELAWYQDPAADVVVTLADSANPTTTIECTFSGAALTGAVPTSVLGSLTNGQIGGFSVEIGAQRSTSIAVGGRLVQLALRNLTVSTRFGE